jgi:hypothetical protein
MGRRRAVTFVAIRIIEGANGKLRMRAIKGEKEHKRRVFWYTKEQVEKTTGFWVWGCWGGWGRGADVVRCEKTSCEKNIMGQKKKLVGREYGNTTL